MAYAAPVLLAALLALMVGRGTVLPPLLGAMGVIGVASYQLYLCASAGQSIGKRRMGIRVVLEDGNPASLFHILLLRNFIPALLGYLLGLLDPPDRDSANALGSDLGGGPASDARELAIDNLLHRRIL